MYFIGANRSKGSALVIVLVGSIALFAIVTALLTISATNAARNTVTASSYARDRVTRSAKNVLAQCLLDGLQNNGDFSTVAAKAVAASARLGDGLWTTTLSNVSVPSFNLGDRYAAFGATDGAPMYVSGRVARARLTPVSASLSLSGKPNGTDTVNSNLSLSLFVAEIPATEFAFIVSDSAFQQSAKTVLTVSGRALFNRGISPQAPLGLAFDGLVTSYGCYFGASALAIPPFNDANYRPMPLGAAVGFTRGISGMPNLLANPTSSVATMIDRQAISRPSTNYLRLSWSDPSTAPAGLVPGITMAPILGVNRIVVDLAAYSGYQNIWVDCTTPATAANGVVVLGSTSGNVLNSTPLTISTDGMMMLLGPNARPVITATNFGLAIGADRSTPSNAPSANVNWTGYVCFALTNPVISSPCTWGGFSFVIQGTLAIPGGTLDNSAVPMKVMGSTSTALALASGDVLADRLFFVECR